MIALMTPLTLSAAEKGPTENETIEALIKHVKGLKEATFIRNGSAYNAKTAGKFLRGKWRANADEIKTATDFIEKAASVSSTTGKPYIIRLKGGGEIKCGDYLKEALRKLEESRGGNA